MAEERGGRVCEPQAAGEGLKIVVGKCKRAPTWLERAPGRLKILPKGLWRASCAVSGPSRKPLKPSHASMDEKARILQKPKEHRCFLLLETLWRSSWSLLGPSGGPFGAALKLFGLS